MGVPYSDGSVGRTRLHGKNRPTGVGTRGLTVSRTTQRLPSPVSSLGAVGSSSACTATESPTNSCRLIATAFFFCPLPCAHMHRCCDSRQRSALSRLQRAAWPGRGRRASASYVKRWGVCGLEGCLWPRKRLQQLTILQLLAGSLAPVDGGGERPAFSRRSSARPVVESKEVSKR